MNLIKKLNGQTLRRASLSAATVLASLGCIGAEAEDAATPPPEEPFVSGTLNLSVNTHFISYGQDVWAAGTSWEDPLFNPSLELSFDLGKGFSAILGTWWDVNSNAPSSIGDVIQEVDVWAGFGYGVGKFSFTVLYQEWMYASQSERIVDFKVGYSHWLNPSLTLHGRVDGAEPFDTGLVTVLGLAPGTALGPVNFSFPVNVAFDTDNFHGGDAGFSFVSAGVSAGIPMTFIKRGDWTLNLGVTYYHTNEDVIPGNPETDFLTGSAGVVLAF